MAPFLRYTIAGVDYVVRCPAGLAVCALGVVEARFTAHLPPGNDLIGVNVAPGDVPTHHDWPVLASNGPGWSIRQSSAQRCLCLGDPVAAAPTARVACWDIAAQRATVFCRPEQLMPSPDGAAVGNPAGYPIDQILLMYYLASRQGLLVHAAGLIADGRALVFPGVSGAGKSTLARQCQHHGWTDLMSDDRVAVRIIDGGCNAYGTPWPGDALAAANSVAPLAAIVFPVKSENNRMRTLHPQDALARLLPAASILWHEPDLLTSQLATCEHLLRRVPSFELAWSLQRGLVDDVQALLRHL